MPRNPQPVDGRIQFGDVAVAPDVEPALLRDEAFAKLLNGWFRVIGLPRMDAQRGIMRNPFRIAPPGGTCLTALVAVSMDVT